MRSFLHFVSFSWNLSAEVRLTRVSKAAWMWLSWFLLIVSKMVVSSTYFQTFVAGTSSSLIMMMNSHGPNFVPWGKQSWPSLNRCLREVRKSMIQEITGSRMSYKHNFPTKIRRSVRTKAFLKLGNHPHSGPITVSGTVAGVDHAN